MKLRSLGLLVIIFAFTVSMFGCNPEAKKKDKYASFIKEYMEWMKTDDFKKAFTDPQKGEAKANELIKKYGFTETELKDLDTKYKDDPEIKKLSEDMMKLAEEVNKKFMEENQNLMQKQDDPNKKLDDGTAPPTDKK